MAVHGLTGGKNQIKFWSNAVNVDHYKFDYRAFPPTAYWNLFPNQDLDIEDFNDLRPEGIFK